jgi:predicted RecB family nuclease
VIDEHDRHDAQTATRAALDRGDKIIVNGWLPADEVHGRIGRPDLLVKVDDGYLPVEVKLHLLSQAGNGTLESSPLDAPFPRSSRSEVGLRLRKGSIWVNDAMQLMHYRRILEHLGYAGSADGLLGGVIDGSQSLWWIDLDAAVARDQTSIGDLYDRRFEERMELAMATVARNEDRSLPRARAPWWHKDCETCPYSELCHDELSITDDVSLVRWVSPEVLKALRGAGITTRRDLAGLDLGVTDLSERLRDTTMPLPVVIDRARSAEPSALLEDVVGSRMGVRRHIASAGFVTAADLLGRDATTLSLVPSVLDLGRLVRRARAHLAGGVVLQVDPEQLDASRADVEIDVDMESYNHATYLWGAYVSTTRPIDGIEEGYRAFVTFDPLTPESEAQLFADFWKWLSSLRALAMTAQCSLRVYCFWKPAEEGQMVRAATTGGDGIPSVRALRRFFSSSEWVDLHQLAKDQLVTQGPLGLKVLAGIAGFSWRDEDPSGEASIGWYEEATRDGSSAARERLLTYNEDDVLATRALRHWLDGPARSLPHVRSIGGHA